MEKTIKVYRVELEDKGGIITLNPYIPYGACPYEDKVTPRIPCALTILGCLRSLQIPSNPMVNKEDLNHGGAKLYLYEADIEARYIYRPTDNEVPDAYYTGELWIMNTQDVDFYKVRSYNIRKQLELPNCAYTRYIVNEEEQISEVPDFVATTVIYGDSMSFSYIEFDPERAEEAMKYAEENRLYY